MAAIGLVLNHGGLDGIEETKVHVDAGTGPCVDLHSLFRPGFRGQDPEFARTHRRYSSPTDSDSDTYSDAGTTYIRQPAGDNRIGSDTDPNPATDPAPDCRANSDSHSSGTR